MAAYLSHPNRWGRLEGGAGRQPSGVVLTCPGCDTDWTVGGAGSGDYDTDTAVCLICDIDLETGEYVELGSAWSDVWSDEDASPVEGTPVESAPDSDSEESVGDNGCPACMWLADKLQLRGGLEPFSSPGPCPLRRPDLWNDTWIRVVDSGALRAGAAVSTAGGPWVRFELQSPIPPPATHWDEWCRTVERPTSDDIYLQPWNGAYVQQRVPPGHEAVAFHVTRLENLVQGALYAGPHARGILHETVTRSVNGDPVCYRGGIRAGEWGHGGRFGVFVVNYFPGSYWCPAGSGNCVLELGVYSATTVKGGSACRSCAQDPVGALSTKVVVRAVVVPLVDVPPPLRP